MAASEKLIKNFVKPIMKNFQLEHGQCDSIIFPQNIFLDFCFTGSMILLLLTGPGIYPQIYHRIPCPAVLICKG